MSVLGSRDPAWLDAVRLAEAVRRREISSRELVDLFLQRVERHNATVNAVVTLDPERARARAQAADDALAHRVSWGPLHGVPITVKDTLETAGLRTTAGFPALAEHVPAAHAVAVQRLVDGGAIVLGKSNTPTLAADWQTYNPIFGTTSNPWNVTRTPGGSSGGSAAATASALSALEYGSDIAGSIRVPAHWCGVYGHKPTHGLVPPRGHIPGPPGMLAEPDLAVVGPLARSADDLEVALRLTAGPLPDRAKGWRLELPPPRHEGLRGYRVAAWLDDPEYPVDPSYRAVLESTLETLRAAGVTVDDTARPGFELSEMLDVYWRLVWPIMLSAYPPEVFDALIRLGAEAPEESREPRVRMARAGTARHRDWLAANELRQHLRARMAELFERFDVVLMPVSQVAAIPHDHSEPMDERTIQVGGERRPYYELMAWIGVATVTLLPATVAPVGRTKDGLPVGIQIVAPYLEDRTAIHFARRITDVVGAFVPPPVD